MNSYIAKTGSAALVLKLQPNACAKPIILIAIENLKL